MRRVVTGHDEHGKSVVISDGPIPRHHESTNLPGWASAVPWATEPGQLASRTCQQDITPTIANFVPEPGGTRFIILTLPPESAMSSPAFDPVAFNQEQLAESPGIAELMEIENPGMHTTPTVDYCIVLSGRVTLELDDSALTRLSAGDIVVQNSTRHGWRNFTDEPVTLAFVLIGRDECPRPPNLAETSSHVPGSAEAGGTSGQDELSPRR